MLARAGATEADIEAFLQLCQDQEAAEALSSVSLRPMHHGQQEQKSSTKSGGSQSESPAHTPQVDDAASGKDSDGFQTLSGLGIMASAATSAASSAASPPICDVSTKAEPAYFAQRFEPKPHSLSYQQGAAGFDNGHGHGPYSSFGSMTPAPAPNPSGSSFDKLDVLASATLQHGSCCEGKTQCTTSTSLPTPATEAQSPSMTEPSTGTVTPLSSYAPELSPGTATVVQDFSSPMEMSCNAAAAIIAEMQAHSDRDIARSQLGCRGRNECFVRNTVLFQILEK